MNPLMASPWFWWGVALALFALEALLPGTFMLWLGFAAIGTALIEMVVPMSGAGQWMLFAILSLISVGAGWQYKKRHPATVSDQPLLNRRGEQLVGLLAYALPKANGKAGEQGAPGRTLFRA